MPKRLRRELPGHEVRTVQEMGWAGIKNGALLRMASGQFDAFLTVDQGIEYQQDLSGLTPRKSIDDSTALGSRRVRPRYRRGVLNTSAVGCGYAM